VKKLFYQTLIVSFVIVLAACTKTKSEPVKGVIKPGDKIGEMAVEQSTEVPYPNIWWFCEFGPDTQEPFSYTTDCEVPLISSLDIGVMWLAKESKFESNWEAITWELYVDGYQLDLESFNWVEHEYIAKGEDNKSRDLVITLKNLTPGEHTFRYLLILGNDVNDGWNVYQPGTYEQVVNFTVLEKIIYPHLSSSANIGQNPYSSEKAGLDFLLYLPSDYGKDPQQKWPLIVYLHPAPLRGATLELLKKDEPLPRKLEKENDFPFIVVSPLGDGEYEFWAKDEMIDPLFTLLEEIRATYSIDEKKIYLTGSDMGGNGVWAIGLRYPEYFAALAPVAGYFGWPPEVPENICDLKDVPVWAFHGGRDDIIPVEAGQELVDALNDCGGNAKFTVSQDMKIDVLYKVYADPELYEWLLEQTQE
jgi:pimeloyl-ACP methyl ester carboxylesterase